MNLYDLVFSKILYKGVEIFDYLAMYIHCKCFTHKCKNFITWFFVGDVKLQSWLFSKSPFDRLFYCTVTLPIGFGFVFWKISCMIMKNEGR